MQQDSWEQANSLQKYRRKVSTIEFNAKPYKCISIRTIDRLKLCWKEIETVMRHTAVKRSNCQRRKKKKCSKRCNAKVNVTGLKKTKFRQHKKQSKLIFS